MKITVSNIPVIDSSNINEEKVQVIDALIENIKPLFDELRPEKESEIKQLKTQLNEINKKINQIKKIIIKLTNEYELEKAKQKLLQRISKLVKSGIVYDPQIKKELIIILKVIPKMKKEQIEQNSRKILDILNKKFDK